jgi:TPR repeat protein
LGNAYDCGKGVEPDLEEVVKWYRLAAEQGHKYAKKKVLEVERRIE